MQISIYFVYCLLTFRLVLQLSEIASSLQFKEEVWVV